MKPITKEEMAVELNNAMDEATEHEKEGGPSTDVYATITSTKWFIADATALHKKLMDDPEWRADMSQEAADEVLGRFGVAVEQYGRSADKLREAVYEADGTPASRYTPEVRRAAAKAQEAAVRLRGVVGTVTRSADEADAWLRAGMGIGENIRAEKPFEVHFVAGQQLHSLRDPRRRAELSKRGVPVAALEAPLKKAVDALDGLLSEGAAKVAGVARAGRDKAHLEVEFLGKQILGLVWAAMGTEAKDRLRAVLPKAAATRKKEEVVTPAVTGGHVVEPVKAVMEPAATTGSGVAGGGTAVNGTAVTPMTTTVPTPAGGYLMNGTHD